MPEEIYQCPCCGDDITEYVKGNIVLYNRRKNVEKMRKEQESTSESRERRNDIGAKNLARWRENNKHKVKCNANKAQAARTAETFTRQGETIKETNQRKAIKLAELLIEEKFDGNVISRELQAELVKKASMIIREELKLERKAKKNKK